LTVKNLRGFMCTEQYCYYHRPSDAELKPGNVTSSCYRFGYCVVPVIKINNTTTLKKDILFITKFIL